MSAKFSRNKKLELLFSAIGSIDPNADSKIKGAIEFVYSWIKENPSCSLLSKNVSLSKVIREHVDPVYSTYAKSVGLPAREISRCLSDPDKLLLALNRFIANAKSELNVSLDDPYSAEFAFSQKFSNLAPTLDALIDFVFICTGLVGKDSQVVELSGNIVSKKRGKTPKQSKFDRKTPIHRNFFDAQNLCELCSDFTEQATEILRASSRTIEDPDDALTLVHAGARIQTLGFSTRFCYKHSPQQDPSQYQATLAKKEFYHAMRRFLIIARQISHHDPGSIVLMRALSFHVVDTLPNKKLYKAIPDLVDRFVAVDDTELLYANEIKNHCLLIIESLKSENDVLSNLLYDLLLTEQNKHDGAYSSAIECGIIPKLVDSNLSFAFPAITGMIYSQYGLHPPHPLVKRT